MPPLQCALDREPGLVVVYVSVVVGALAGAGIGQRFVDHVSQDFFLRLLQGFLLCFAAMSASVETPVEMYMRAAVALLPIYLLCTWRPRNDDWKLASSAHEWSDEHERQSLRGRPINLLAGESDDDEDTEEADEEIGELPTELPAVKQYRRYHGMAFEDT